MERNSQQICMKSLEPRNPDFHLDGSDQFPVHSEGKPERDWNLSTYNHWLCAPAFLYLYVCFCVCVCVCVCVRIFML